MALFRKKPVADTIEAWQWFPDSEQFHDVVCTVVHNPAFVEAPSGPHLHCRADNTIRALDPGDWIIRVPRGFTVCKADVFVAMYEPVTD